MWNFRVFFRSTAKFEVILGFLGLLEGLFIRREVVSLPHCDLKWADTYRYRSSFICSIKTENYTHSFCSEASRKRIKLIGLFRTNVNITQPSLVNRTVKKSYLPLLVCENPFYHRWCCQRCSRLYSKQRWIYSALNNFHGPMKHIFLPMGKPILSMFEGSICILLTFKIHILRSGPQLSPIITPREGVEKWLQIS